MLLSSLFLRGGRGTAAVAGNRFVALMVSSSSSTSTLSSRIRTFASSNTSARLDLTGSFLVRSIPPNQTPHCCRIIKNYCFIWCEWRLLLLWNTEKLLEHLFEVLRIFGLCWSFWFVSLHWSFAKNVFLVVFVAPASKIVNSKSFFFWNHFLDTLPQ